MILSLTLWRRLLPVVGACCLTLGAHAQQAVPPVGDDADTTTFSLPAAGQHLDQKPTFPGGYRALQQFIAGQLHYPIEAYRQYLTGFVKVRCLVDSRGQVQRTEVLKPLGLGCDEEAQRVLMLLPHFTPAVKDHMTTSAYVDVKVYFGVTPKDRVGLPMVRFDTRRPSVMDLAPDSVTGPDGNPTAENPKRASVAIGRVMLLHPSPERPAIAGAGTLSALPSGGTDALYAFVARATKYPKAARKARVRGHVTVSVVVDEQGRLSQPTVTQGLGNGCDEEALRVVSLINASFAPAQDNQGRAIVSMYEVPVYFPPVKLRNYYRYQLQNALNQMNYQVPLH